MKTKKILVLTQSEAEYADSSMKFMFCIIHICLAYKEVLKLSNLKSVIGELDLESGANIESELQTLSDTFFSNNFAFNQVISDINQYGSEDKDLVESMKWIAEMDETQKVSIKEIMDALDDHDEIEIEENKPSVWEINASIATQNLKMVLDLLKEFNLESFLGMKSENESRLRKLISLVFEDNFKANELLGLLRAHAANIQGIERVTSWIESVISYDDATRYSMLLSINEYLSNEEKKGAEIMKLFSQTIVFQVNSETLEEQEGIKRFRTVKEEVEKLFENQAAVHEKIEK